MGQRQGLDPGKRWHLQAVHTEGVLPLRLEASMKLIWLTSVAFSALVIAAHRHLESRYFLMLAVVLALVHLLVVARSRAGLSLELLASGGVIALTTFAAVTLYVFHVAGATDDATSVLWSFVVSDLTSPRVYSLFGVYALLMLGVFAVLWRAMRSGNASFMPYLYSASAVNLVCDYSWRQPFFHVGGEPDARGFFFAAGIFGLEFSAPLFLLVLAICVWRFWRAGS